jgi:hypothetical protein
MTRFLPILGFIACVVLAFDVSAADICMPANKDNQIEEGRLVQKTLGGERVYILQVPTPECLSGDSPSDNVKGATTIQIMSSDDKVTKLIGKFVGKSVQVTGRLFGATTPKHKAPIVMDLSDIDEI